MTLDQYNEAVKSIFAEQQSIAQSTAELAFTGRAIPTSPEFTQLLTKQWHLIQELAKLNTEMMMGVLMRKT